MLCLRKKCFLIFFTILQGKEYFIQIVVEVCELSVFRDKKELLPVDNCNP